MGKRLAILLLAATAVQAAAGGSQTVEIPFALHRDYLLLIGGAIGPRRDLVLLVDTGSGRTIIDKTLARSLGVEGRATELESFGAQMTAEEAVIPDLRLGTYQAGKQEVVVTDLSRTAAVMQLPRLDGIVGIDVLARGSFAIDYARGCLLFGPPVPTPFRTRFKKHPVFVVVPARVEGQSVNLIVDSGASHVVLVGPAAHRGVGTGELELLSHLAGVTGVRPLLLRELRIGRWLLRDVIALVAHQGIRATADTDGLLGLRALGARFVQFDLERHEMGWRF